MDTHAPRKALPDSMPEHGYLASFDQLWSADQCDTELVVEDVSLPVHSIIMCQWSRVLSGCIAAAETEQGARISVPLEDSMQAIRDVLKLIYSMSGTEQLQRLLQGSRQRYQDAFRVADKYDMPGLLAQLESFLISQLATDPSSTVWATPAEAISWLKLCCSVRLDRLAQAAEDYVRKNASEAFLCQAAQDLPVSSTLRMIAGLLKDGRSAMSIYPAMEATAQP